MKDCFNHAKVVVTGASGFIGAHLVAALESAAAEVFALVRQHSNVARLVTLQSRARRIALDLLDFEAVGSELAAIQPDYVFHAAVSRDHGDWQSSLALNGAATINLLHASLSPALKKFVHCGSSLEYGDIQAPFGESDAIRPTSLFGASKAAGTLQLQQLALSKGLPVVILRLFHVYGVLENQHRLVPSASRSLLAGTPIALTGPGYQHDFVHVSDVVKACLLAAGVEQSSGKIINIASGIPVTNEQVVALLARISGRQARVETGAFPAREWDRKGWYADISRAKDLLGWQPETSLEDGLRQSLAWQLENG